MGGAVLGFRMQWEAPCTLPPPAALRKGPCGPIRALAGSVLDPGADRLVDPGPGGHDVASPQPILAPVGIADPATRLEHHQRARGDVVRRQVQLPVAVEAPRGN